MDGSVKRLIARLRGGRREAVEDDIAVEKRLRVSVNGREVLSLYCTPIMIRELVAGLVSTQGLVEGQWCADDISILYGEEITADLTASAAAEVAGATLTSGCAGGVVFAERQKGIRAGAFSIEAGRLTGLYKAFHGMPGLYRQTGCVHSAGLSDGKEILCIAEDIGRHNAVDKAIGWALIEGVALGDKIMLASGRLTSEMLSKCARWGMPLLCSRAAPTDMALKIAGEYEITVVGFLRGEGMNIYTHPERIL
jgi:FdhD protein